MALICGADILDEDLAGASLQDIEAGRIWVPLRHDMTMLHSPRQGSSVVQLRSITSARSHDAVQGITAHAS